MKNLLTFLLSSLFSLSAFACSCAEFPNAEVLLQSDSPVFLGIPEKSVQIGEGDEWGPVMQTRFTVVRAYKNVSGAQIDVLSTKDNGANCGVHFKGNDGLYLITTFGGPNRAGTSGCGIAYVSSDNEYMLKLLSELSLLSHQ